LFTIGPIGHAQNVVEALRRKLVFIGKYFIFFEETLCRTGARIIGWLRSLHQIMDAKTRRWLIALLIGIAFLS